MPQGIFFNKFLGLLCFLAAGSLGIAAIPFCASLPHAVTITLVLFFMVMFLSGGFVVLSLAYGATTQSPANTGFLAGFCISGWSLTTGVLMWMVGRMFDRGMYEQSFWLVAVLPSVGVALWWLISGQTKTSVALVEPPAEQIPV